MGNLSGPPIRPEFQCQAFLRRRQKRCGKWRLKGSKYCQFHGGRRKIRAAQLDTTTPSIYRHQLRGTLAQRIAELATLPPNEQFRLTEELQLMRATAIDAVALYQGAVDKGDGELVATAGAVLRAVLGQVADMCERAARVETLSKDKLSVTHLGYIVTQIVRIAWLVFGDHPELVKLFERKLREELKIADTGTTITPDQDVTAMDETIPKGEL